MADKAPTADGVLLGGDDKRQLWLLDTHRPRLVLLGDDGMASVVPREGAAAAAASVTLRPEAWYEAGRLALARAGGQPLLAAAARAGQSRLPHVLLVGVLRDLLRVALVIIAARAFSEVLMPTLQGIALIAAMLMATQALFGESVILASARFPRRADAGRPLPNAGIAAAAAMPVAATLGVASILAGSLVVSWLGTIAGLGVGLFGVLLSLFLSPGAEGLVARLLDRARPDASEDALAARDAEVSLLAGTLAEEASRRGE